MTKYWYNDVLLPEIPADMLATNPYVWIRKNTSSGNYDLCFAPEPWYANGGMYFPNIDSVTSYRYTVPIATSNESVEWSYANSGTFSYYTIDDARTVMWANHDIPNGSATSTTIYFAALPAIEEIHNLTKVLSVEAETGILSGTAVVDDRAQYSQNIVVDGITHNNGSLSLDFTVDKSDFYLIDMLFTHSGTRGFKYEINGKTYMHGNVVGTDYYAIEHYKFTIYLSEGTNNIKFSGYSKTYAPMFDRFDVYAYTTYDRKYLIRSDSTLYTITDGALVALEETVISAEIFQTDGLDKLPENSLLANLINPEILYWHDSSDELPKMKISVTGIPPIPQTVITNTQDMSDSTILGIEGIQAVCSDDILFALSFDDEVTWKAYNGTSWITLDLPNTGMTKTTMESIGLEAWAEVITSDYYKVRFILPTTTSYMTSMVVNYIN